MRFLLFFVLMACSILTSAANTVITGTIRNAVSKNIVVYVDRLYLDNTIITETTALNSENKFSFDLEINIPQLITIEYARNTAQLYLEPGGHLDVEFEANSFKFSMVFGGSCGSANEFLYNFKKQFPEETNKFKMKQVKKGIVYYEIEEPMEKKMKTLGPINFSSDMNSLRERKKRFKESFEQRKGYLPEMFSKYINAEIDYDWGYKMMVYYHSFKNLHAIPDDFANFIQEINLVTDNVLGNKKYRDFLIAFVNYKHDTSNPSGNPYIGQYEMAEQHLNGVPLAFFQADILARGFRKSELNELLPTYNTFVSSVPYNEFYLRAVDAYFSKKPYATGSPAPNFTMFDENGSSVSLSDFQGKIVLINFWASWCRPCINKLESMKTLKSWSHNQEIVFINVSLERDEEKFKSEVYDRSITNMVNLYASEGMKTQIITDYNVQAIPEFFIISKSGTFARKPSKTDPFTMEKHLKTLF